MRNLVILLIVSLSFACTSEESSSIQEIDGNQVMVCDLNLVKDTIDFKLSDLIESCQMVRLETNNDALFDRAWHTSISKNYIAIKSYGRFPVKLFTRDGEFICNLGAIGRGPGEYTSLYGIQLDEPRDRVYLTPFANATSLLVYNLKGEQQKDIPLAFKTGKVRTFIEGNTLTALCMPLGNSGVTAYTQKLDGTVISEVEAKSHHFSRDYNNEVFSYNNSTHFEFHNTTSDTLIQYNAKENKLTPTFHLSKPADQDIYSSLYSLPIYYYAWISKKGRLLVDKKSGESHFVKLKNDFFGSFEVDLWGGVNGMYINVIPAITLKDKIAEALESKSLSDKDRTKLLQIDKDTEEEDNPIVFFGKFALND